MYSKQIKHVKNSIFALPINYLNLTKPTIMLLVVSSAAASLFMANAFPGEIYKVVLALVAVYLTGGSANALNQYFERDIDARMARTKNRRPLPSKKINPSHALVFSISIGVIGVAMFAFFFNWLSAILSLSTIIFYGFFYTLWLKPNTVQNIVIGGIAGAMAPVGVWAAASGKIEIEPLLLFAVIFFWTPPHFWALAIFCKNDYDEVGYPMMPNVKGINETMKQMVIYTVLTFLASLGLAMAIFPSILYFLLAFGLGIVFLRKVWVMYKQKDESKARSVFGYSIIYLFSLLTALILDSFLIKLKLPILP